MLLTQSVPIKKKVLLIEPPFYRLFKDTYSLDRYPLSLGYLAGSIKRETDWEVMAYNADFNPRSERMKISYLANEGFANYLKERSDLTTPVWREVRSAISEYKPDVVGISAKSQNFNSACMVAGLAKEINRGIVTIVGGPHPSMVGRDAMGCQDIDISVIGEGERTIAELLNALAGGRDLGVVTGIIYRRDGSILENGPREFIEDLDSLPFPSADASGTLKDYKRYPKVAFKNILATRGCPYDCLFCGSYKIWSRRPRFRRPENVTREITSLQHKGLGSVHFSDDTFGIEKRYIKSLCHAIIERCPAARWSCETHVKLLDEDIVTLMKKAGCFSIQLGVESGDDGILKNIRKNFTIEEALAACGMIRRHGIELRLFFMLGSPFETEETLSETARLIKKIKCDELIYSIFTPYPGTEAFELCRDRGLIRGAYDASLYNHQSPLNAFFLEQGLAPERFREVSAGLERAIDRKNSLMRLKRIFSRGAFRRVYEYTHI